MSIFMGCVGGIVAFCFIVMLGSLAIRAVLDLCGEMSPDLRSKVVAKIERKIERLLRLNDGEK